MPSLKELDLQNNKISFLPQLELGGDNPVLPELEKLILNGNDLRIDDLNKLVPILERPTFERLFAFNNPNLEVSKQWQTDHANIIHKIIWLRGQFVAMASNEDVAANVGLGQVFTLEALAAHRAYYSRRDLGMLPRGFPNPLYNDGGFARLLGSNLLDLAGACTGNCSTDCTLCWAVESCGDRQQFQAALRAYRDAVKARNQTLGTAQEALLLYALKIGERYAAAPEGAGNKALGWLLFKWVANLRGDARVPSRSPACARAIECLNKYHMNTPR